MADQCISSISPENKCVRKFEKIREIYKAQRSTVQKHLI